MKMPVTQNGWTAFTNPAGNATRRQVPDTDVWLTVRNGTAGDLLIWVAAEFDKWVESIDNGRGNVDDGAWNYRPIAGSAALSNHASATAIDLNWSKHPLGASGTFTQSQVKAIEAIIADTHGAVRWGGSYSGRKDEMHFEINTDQAGCDRAWAAIQANSTTEDDMPLAITFDLPTKVGNTSHRTIPPVNRGGLPWGPAWLNLGVDHGTAVYRVWLQIDGEHGIWRPVGASGDGYIKVSAEDTREEKDFPLPDGTGKLSFEMISLEGKPDEIVRFAASALIQFGIR